MGANVSPGRRKTCIQRPLSPANRVGVSLSFEELRTSKKRALTSKRLFVLQGTASLTSRNTFWGTRNGAWTSERLLSSNARFLERPKDFRTDKAGGIGHQKDFRMLQDGFLGGPKDFLLSEARFLGGPKRFRTSEENVFFGRFSQPKFKAPEAVDLLRRRWARMLPAGTPLQP